MADKKVNLLEALACADEADLKEVSDEIAKTISRLAQLQAAHKVIDIAVNGPKKRQAPTKKPAGGRPASAGLEGPSNVPLAKRVAAVLGVSGPMQLVQIANQLEVDGRSIAQLIKTPWFEFTNNGYRLTATGRKESGI